MINHACKQLTREGLMHLLNQRQSSNRPNNHSTPHFLLFNRQLRGEDSQVVNRMQDRRNLRKRLHFLLKDCNKRKLERMINLLKNKLGSQNFSRLRLLISLKLLKNKKLEQKLLNLLLTPKYRRYIKKTRKRSKKCPKRKSKLSLNSSKQV